MDKIIKTGSAHWTGPIKEGKGTISTESGALNEHPYGFNTRFEGVRGSNPEELIGAAHAACFSMALSKALGDAGFVAESLDTTARVALEKIGDGFAITTVHLTLKASVPRIDKAQFDDLAMKTKAGCPVSKVLNATITLEATLNT
jgi:osmotically inducible protein OsmC